MPDLILKDGTPLEAPLGRLPQFDPKSRDFPIRKLLQAEGIKKPRSYTWSCQPRLNQGQEGACVGFAFAHEMAARPQVVLGLDDGFARQIVYWEAQKIDPWPGGAYPGAKPRYEGTSVLAGAKRIQQIGYYGEYRWAFNFEDALLTVGYLGPVVLGINWREGMFGVDDRGVIHNTGRIAGGHAILWNGVNVKTKMARLHNSWGNGWGVDGECFISFDDLEALLKEQGECCIPTIRTRPKT